MTNDPVDKGNGAQLVSIAVADPPETWVAAGFTVVNGNEVRIGATTIVLEGRTNGDRGIVSWRLAGLDGPSTDDAGSLVDGLPTEFLELEPTPERAPAHPNGVIGLDHVVVATPDLERTIHALGQVGLTCRRIRETTSYGAPMRQAFFRIGATVVEVVSGDRGSGQPAAEAPATWFGLAVDVDDLDQTGAFLGDGLGAVKAAVQAGRRIATLRHKTFSMSIAVAAMDHHADR